MDGPQNRNYLKDKKTNIDMVEAQFSPYCNDLEEKAETRYKEKLQKLGRMTDPYLKWQSGASIDWQLWPDVEYPRQLYNYLAN